MLEPAWTSAPRWLGGTVYLALGWVAVVATPQLFARLGVAGGLLIVAGGLVYSAGAAVYALRRPDPIPAVFGLKRRLSDAVYRCLLADQRDRPYLAVKSG